MEQAAFVRKVEEVIREYQEIQKVNPPSSIQWQQASAEINRLAAIIVGSAGGASKSRAKKEAARRNGKLGGRPKHSR